MVKKKLAVVSKLPKWAWWGLWVIGIIASLILILWGASQIWLSTWKTYDVKDVVVKVPSGWDVRDTTKDINGGILASGYTSVIKIGDLSTQNVGSPDDTAKYGGNLLIYVIKDMKKGVYYTEIETSGDNTFNTTVYKLIGRIITSNIKFLQK